MSQIRLVYLLHSANLYGTERMALATAEGLAGEFRPVIMAPPGAALAEASRMGFETRPFVSVRELASGMRPIFARSSEIAVIATGVVHSLCAVAMNRLYGRRMAHLHVVHGGTDERLSYGRKRWLNRSAAVLVAVSCFVKERLLAHGVGEHKVEVIENFLPESRTAHCPGRGVYHSCGVQKALVISRVDPIKRVDLLLSAMEQQPQLAAIEVRVLGTGWDLDSLRTRAAESHPNVTFAGFVSDVERELSQTDLLIHLCPNEPFGLAILEAMAAGVAVVVPDRGGAGSLVEDEVSGFRFRADDPAALADRLLAIKAACPSQLNGVAENGRALLRGRFSPAARIDDYRALLYRGLA
jgi:glycosyltransferase involved in cell wall biosynthesis